MSNGRDRYESHMKVKGIIRDNTEVTVEISDRFDSIDD